MLETLLREMDDQESTTTTSTVPVSAAAADGNNSGDNSSGSANASEERDSGVPNDDQINKMMAHSPEELEVTATTDIKLTLC
jgi:hypothetical protein